MSLPPAQTLPYHILESIIEYQEDGDKPWHFLPLQNQAAEITSKLLPLGAVCRDWRQIFCSMYYSSARLTDKSDNLHCNEEEFYGRMLHMAELGVNGYVKQVYLKLGLDTLKCSANLDVAVNRLVQKCQGYPNASGLVLEFDYSRIPRVLGSEAEQKEVFPDSALVVADRLRHYLKQIVPGARKFAMQQTGSWLYGKNNSTYVYKLAAQLSCILGKSTTQLTMNQANVTKPQVEVFSECALTHITISEHIGSQAHIDLIRNNASSLVSLILDRQTINSVLRLTSATSGTGTLVYRRLKHLRLWYCMGSRMSNKQQPTVDPFPALQKLKTTGRFPFSDLQVLVWLMAHVQIADIELDSQMYIEMKGIGLFDQLDGDNCPQLQKLTLHTPNIGRGTYPRKAENELLCHCFQYGIGTVQSLSLRDVSYVSIDLLMRKSIFSDSLRAVNISKIKMSIPLAIMFFSKFPNLQVAEFSICNEQGNQSTCMPTAQEIETYRVQHETLEPSGLKTINVHPGNLGYTRRYAELVVLLADILDSVEMAILGTKRPDYRGGILAHVNRALARPDYENCKVRKVKFKSTIKYE